MQRTFIGRSETSCSLFSYVIQSVCSLPCDLFFLVIVTTSVYIEAFWYRHRLVICVCTHMHTECAPLPINYVIQKVLSFRWPGDIRYYHIYFIELLGMSHGVTDLKRLGSLHMLLQDKVKVVY